MTSIYDVLKASKGIHVDDTFAELWGRKLSNTYSVATYTGTLPATLQTVAGYLESYKIYGDTKQDGTPTPENPIAPSGCGVRTENVMPSAPAETKSSNGVTITCDGNGVYTLSGTALSETYIVFRFKDFTIPISVGHGRQGTMSLFNTVPSGQISMTFLNGSTSIDTWLINSANRKNNSYVTMGGAVCNAILFSAPSGNNCDCVIKPCFTNDSIYPASYIPYGYKLPIIVNGVEYPIYLGESQTTRKIKKLVLTGEEDYTWYKSATRNYSWYVDPNTIGTLPNTPFLCSHGETVTSVSDYSYGKVFCDNTCNLGIFDGAINSVAKLNAYFAQQYAAGTPVTVWYVLAEPETAVVNEPLMKIDDYADTIDSTQTTAQIPTAAGTTVIDYGGEPKPDKVELTYRKRKGQ